MAIKKPYVVNSAKTWLQAEGDLRALFRKWSVTDFDIRRGQRGDAAGEGSCTVTWYPAGGARSVELTSNDQPEPRLNMVKLFLGIEAMELAERRGLASISASYYAQTTAIVEHASTVADRYAPYAVFGLTPGADRVIVDAVYKAKIREAHPDGADGNNAEASRINTARDAIYAERGWK